MSQIIALLCSANYLINKVILSICIPTMRGILIFSVILRIFFFPCTVLIKATLLAIGSFLIITQKVLFLVVIDFLLSFAIDSLPSFWTRLFSISLLAPEFSPISF